MKIVSLIVVITTTLMFAGCSSKGVELEEFDITKMITKKEAKQLELELYLDYIAGKNNQGNFKW